MGPADLRRVSAHDPGFDETAFLAQAENTYWRLGQALRSGDLHSLRGLISPELLARHQAEVDGKKTEHKHSEHEEVQVGTADVAMASTDASYDTIVVDIRPSSPDLPVVRWTFQRPSSLKTPAVGVAGNCTSCGAPVPDASASDCPYCHAALGATRSGWQLTREDVAPHVPQVHIRAPVASSEEGGSKSKGGWVLAFVILAITVPFLIPAVIAVVNAMSAAKKATSAINSPPGPIATTTTLGGRTSWRLALSGGILLSASDLESNEVLETSTGATCATKAANVSAFTLAIKFDSGATITGTFPVVTSGATHTVKAAGIRLEYVGATHATSSHQIWVGAPGSVVELNLDANNNGTVRWEGFKATFQDHDNPEDLSGLLTISCA